MHSETIKNFVITSRTLPGGMRNVSDKICSENPDINFVSYNIFPENRTVYGIMWKNMAI